MIEDFDEQEEILIGSHYGTSEHPEGAGVHFSRDKLAPMILSRFWFPQIWKRCYTLSEYDSIPSKPHFTLYVY